MLRRCISTLLAVSMAACGDASDRSDEVPDGSSEATGAGGGAAGQAGSGAAGASQGGASAGAGAGGVEQLDGAAGSAGAPIDASADVGDVQQACNCTPRVLADAQARPVAIATDATRVYWVNQGIGSYLDGGGTGAVMSVPKAGGTPVALAEGRQLPYSLAVDVDHVYWADEGPLAATGALLRAPISAGGAELLVGGLDEPWAVALDDGHAYWAEHGRIARTPKAGGVPEQLALAVEPSALALDATHAYWNEWASHEIRRAPKESGTAELVVGGPGAPFYLAVDGTHVYYSYVDLPDASADASASFSGGLARVTLGGGTSEPLAKGFFTGVALDANAVWSGEQASADVLRVPKDGSLPNVVATSQQGVYAITVDSNGVYWTIEGGGADPPKGVVVAVDRCCAPP